MKKLLLLLGILPILTQVATAWRDDVNIPKSGALKAMPPTQLTYDLSWKGRVKAGSIDILMGKKDARYPKYFVCQAYGGSTGWARAINPFSLNYIGFLRPDTLRPVMFVGNETEGNKLKSYSNTFTSKSVVGTKTTTRKGKEPVVEKTAFRHNPTLDLFSALLQARSLPLAQGEKVVMPLYPISAPYLARLTVLGREDFGGRNAIKIDIKLQKIGENDELVNYKKMKSATLWLSDDEWRIPLQLRVDAFIGDVRMSLTKQENL